MKWNLFERGITCLLLSAATIAVASGVKLADPPEDDEIAMVAEEEAEEEIAESVAEDVAEESAEVSIEDGESEESLSALVEEAQSASEGEKGAKRETLKNALTEVFRKRTEAQRTRIALMREKLEAIEAQLERRSTAEDQIVQRRMSELLGDKDELSWDHEPEVNLSNQKRAQQEAATLDFIAFPTEYPMEIEIASGRELREQSAAGIASEKRLDAIGHSIREVIATVNADRAKAVQAREQATSRASLAERNARLKDLNRVNRNGNHSHGDREQQVEQLRQELESMRSQSKALEKQLQEISKAK